MKATHGRNGGLTRWLAALLIGAMLNASGLYVASAFAARPDAGPHGDSGNNSETTGDKGQTRFYYGVDRDKVPFALRTDGTKARYISLCPSHIKLQISKTTATGEVEFRRLSSKETLATYTPTGEVPLSIRSTFSPQEGGAKAAVVSLAVELKGRKVVLNLTSNQVQELPANEGADLQVMRTDATANIPLRRLLEEAHTFLSGPALSGLLPFLRQFDYSTTDCRFECARTITSCLAAASAYVGGIAGLILLCGETLGLTCVLAIIAHPILAAAVGMECSAAVNICKACHNSGVTGTNSDFLSDDSFSYWDDYWGDWMALDDHFYQFQSGVSGVY